MELRKSILGVLKYNIYNNELFVLQEESGSRSIRKFLPANDFNQSWCFQNNYYTFQFLGTKLYLTTTELKQYTQVVDPNNGQLLNSCLNITFHFDGQFINDNEFICVATIDDKKGYVIYDIKMEKIKKIYYPPLGINNIYKVINENYYLSMKKEQVNLYKSFTSEVVWEFNIQDYLFNNHFVNNFVLGHNEIDYSKNTLIIIVDNLSTMYRYLMGIDIRTGNVLWCHNDFNNFEIHKGKLYSIGFYGLIQILNIENGNIESEFDLSEAFKHMDINCEHRFNVTDTHIYFKHARKGKFGIINLKDMKLEEVHQLPAGNTISTEEYPISVGNRLYIRSSPQNNLFIYE